MKKLIENIRNGFHKGIGIALGIGATGLLAATVSGTVNTFSTGEILNASLMNENFTSLKTAIESINPQFSTSETATDQKWTDGSTIYRKVVDTGTLPNNTTKDVAHGISGTFTLIRLYGRANNSSGEHRILPFVDSTPIQFVVNGTNISMTTTGNYSAFTNSQTILEYTKN